MKTIKRLIKILIFLVIVVVILNASGFEWPSWVADSYNKAEKTVEEVISTIEDEATEESEGKTIKVKRVVDGDTFVIDNDGTEEKVRLIGVDTPESVATGKNAYKNCEEGKIASNYTEKLIENKEVKIVTDVSERDTYGRILAYVYLEDGRMLNKVLLRKGYARMMTIVPNVSHVEEFEKIQEKAKKNKVGFWENFDQWN